MMEGTQSTWWNSDKTIRCLSVAGLILCTRPLFQVIYTSSGEQVGKTKLFINTSKRDEEILIPLYLGKNKDFDAKLLFSNGKVSFR